MDIKIDWSIFDGEPESTCYCKCNKIYRSHAKAHFHEGNPYIVTMKKCPLCGESISNCYRIQSDPEAYTI